MGHNESTEVFSADHQRRVEVTLRPDGTYLVVLYRWMRGEAEVGEEDGWVRADSTTSICDSLEQALERANEKLR